MLRITALLLVCIFIVSCMSTRTKQQEFENIRGLTNRGTGIEYYCRRNIPKLGFEKQYFCEILNKEDVKKHNKDYAYYKIEYDKNGFPKKAEAYDIRNKLVEEWFYEYGKEGRLKNVRFNREVKDFDGRVTWIVDIYNAPSDEKTK